MSVSHFTTPETLTIPALTSNRLADTSTVFALILRAEDDEIVISPDSLTDIELPEAV
jgi:hypothetical protein